MAAVAQPAGPRRAAAALAWGAVFAPALVAAADLGTAGADPARWLVDRTGLGAAWLLAAVLLLSPLRVLLPRVRLALELNHHRRLVGVAAAAWATLHALAFVPYVGGPGGIAAELDKPFVLVGLAAWAILVVLAVTSLRSWVRRLGARRWKLLHRAAYVAAVLAALHQAMQERGAVRETWLVWLPLLVLQLARMIVVRRAVARRPASLPAC